MNMHWCSLKSDCTIKFSIPKGYKNTPSHNFNTNHAARNNHKVTITLIENDGNKMINTENVKVDEHALVLIKNKLHH